ncbi:hypothetical protein ACTSKR_11305 [Chitinibacteraceae bacterium HSL-7]
MKKARSIPYRDLLYLIPLVTITLWLLADPPRWLQSATAILGDIAALGGLLALIALWVLFWQVVAALLTGGRR